MAQVPHVRFQAPLEPDPEFPHPPGGVLARMLECRLRSRFGSAVQPVDCWRDCGWQVLLRIGEKPFAVYFAQMRRQNEWLLGIAPLGRPGWIGRLLARRPVECAAELKMLAQLVQSLLHTLPGAAAIQWAFNGLPGSVPAVATPEELPWTRSPAPG